MREKLIEVFSTNLTSFFLSRNKHFDLFHKELISQSPIIMASTTHVLYSWRQKSHSAFIGFNLLVIKAVINPIMENCLVII